VLVAVLVPGRSGSAMTAQIGVMRVTEEIDALATMGVSRSQRLVLPKVLALAVAMPLLVIWCSAAGIIGGMVAANLQMGLSYGFFIDTLPRVVPVANLWIGLGKGLVFGMLIALIACHFGLRVNPNTESLSALTTSSVVPRSPWRSRRCRLRGVDAQRRPAVMNACPPHTSKRCRRSRFAA
jgi:phospholipid/cholesterol/gamma-HCH transport system permease protein